MAFLSVAAALPFTVYAHGSEKIMRCCTHKERVSKYCSKSSKSEKLFELGGSSLHATLNGKLSRKAWYRDNQESEKSWNDLNKGRKESGSAGVWEPLGKMVMTFLISLTINAYANAGVVDTTKMYVCLSNECSNELRRCIVNPSYAAYLGCIESCTTSPTETACQMRGGDLSENEVVADLNGCALSRKKCVPKKPDDVQFPKLHESAVAKELNIADFAGKWYISSGLSPLFDLFDCQVHEFKPMGNQLNAKMTWRISIPDGGFFTRSTILTFSQDLLHPGLLHSHDSAYLHSQDDWYIIASKIKEGPDDYVLVYYRGNNDAWDGYGGAVVYTRSPVLPSSILPELEEASKIAGLDIKKFKDTNNSFRPQPSFIKRVVRLLEEGAYLIFSGVGMRLLPYLFKI